MIVLMVRRLSMPMSLSLTRRFGRRWRQQRRHRRGWRGGEGLEDVRRRWWGGHFSLPGQGACVTTLVSIITTVLVVLLLMVLLLVMMRAGKKRRCRFR